MNPPLGTIIIYARDIQKTANFYAKHFGFKTSGEVLDGLIELSASNGGAGILIQTRQTLVHVNADRAARAKSVGSWAEPCEVLAGNSFS